MDYLSIGEGDFDKILDFEIGHINEYSDHGYLDFTIKVEICDRQKKTKNAKSREEFDGQDTSRDDVLRTLKTNYACNFKCSDESKQKITNCLNSEEIKNSLNELNSCLNDITVPEAVFRLRQIFVNISDKSFEKTNFGKVGINKKGKHKKVPWMNEECKALKGQFCQKTISGICSYSLGC